MKPDDSRAIPAGTAQEPDDVSIPDFVGMLCRNWRLIAVITLLCTVAATLAAFLMTPIYEAKVVLAPVKEDNLGALDKLSGAFGGLAEIAGVNLGSTGSNAEEAIALLESRMLSQQFIDEAHLMPILFAGDWDPERASWVAQDPADAPTPGDAFELWDEKIRKVETSTTSSLVTLIIDWKDRNLAAQWATELVRRANELMRSRDIAEARSSIEFLNAELAKTSIVEVQLAIHRLIESQIKTMTLAKVREEYFFRVIDPAVVPDADEYVEPKRLLMIIVGLVGGAMLALMVVIMKNALRPARRTDRG